MDKKDFFQKYAHCAAPEVLGTIWEARESGATSLDLSFKEISDLSPLAGLVNLQELYCDSTQVSDLSPLAGLVKNGLKIDR